MTTTEQDNLPFPFPNEVVKKLSEYFSIRLGRKIEFKHIHPYSSGAGICLSTDEYCDNMGVFALSMRSYRFDLEVLCRNKPKDAYLYGKLLLSWQHKNGGTNGDRLNIILWFDENYNFVEV